jgi:uncharacterized protein YpuA (DUF1002 family)
MITVSMETDKYDPEIVGSVYTSLSLSSSSIIGLSSSSSGLLISITP